MDSLQLNPLAKDFVIENSSQELLLAYHVLAELEYPIPDRKTFEKRINELEQSQKEKNSNQVTETQYLSILVATDFPLMSPQSAMEKFSVAMTRNFTTPGSSFSIPGPRDEPQPPVPNDPFFGSDACGIAAQGVYEETLTRFGFLPGANRGAFNSANDFARRCRARIPNYGTGLCSNQGQRAWADCYAEGYLSGDSFNIVGRCNGAGERAVNACLARFRPRPRPFPFPFPWPFPFP